MLRYLFILVLIFANSCGSQGADTDTSSKAVPGIYTLNEIIGGRAGGELKGDKLPFEETYKFRSDGTFIRLRKDQGQSIELTGTYELKSYASEQHIELSYDQNSDIVGNCSGKEKWESFYINEQNALQNNWMACDGPGYVYTRQ
ncbi:hypothetical protein [Nonlabens xiamenensis]|uniref:hypothetical protein n=1 Tax=Nonlabens xiamenensis TaxID=2341043 RepID=UPI000F608727|nr:hypothetical protein [Nonlabens xiamenensis]